MGTADFAICDRIFVAGANICVKIDLNPNCDRPMRILVVEDDPFISLLLERLLEGQNYAIDFGTDGQMALDLNAAYEYDAILLDVSLPKLDGMSVCRQIRAGGSAVPILLLTALDSPGDRARGLDAGADDYLGKPFDPDELLARVRALLRRSHQQPTPILAWGSLQLDPVSATVTYDNRLISLTAKEYALLELFLRNHKRVFSCDAILDHIWAYDDAPSAEAIRTHIKGLRQKLKSAGANPDFIETVYGIGYRLKPLDALRTDAIADTWAQFKDQILDRVAELERLANNIANGDSTSEIEAGRSIAHALSGSLGMFGFSLSSELARQIESYLGSGRQLNAEQGRWLVSTVAALEEELNRPPSPPDVYNLDPDPAIDILLISDDDKLERSLQAVAIDRGASALRNRHWHVRTIATITAAKSLLQSHQFRCIVLSEAIADRAEEVLQLLLDTGKNIPPIPVIIPTDAPELDPAIDRLGCIKCSPDSADIIATIESAIARVEASQSHILIVDDDLKILAILRSLLIPWGFRVTTLADPQQFWEIFAQAAPDLLILDVEMPGISGLDLFKQVRERGDRFGRADAARTQLPIIFLTAHTEPDLIREVFALGADDFVTKPVVGAEIVTRITHAIDRQQHQRLRAVGRQQNPSDRPPEFKLETSQPIEQAIQAENERHARKIEQILQRFGCLRPASDDC